MHREMKGTGILWIGNIPENWSAVKLKTLICCLDGRRVPITADMREDGPYPYWGAGSVTDYVNKYIFDEELILLGEDGAPFFDTKRDVAFYVNEKVWVNNHIHVLKALEKINIRFLLHYLNIVNYGFYINGSILNKLTQSNMNKITVALPPSKEQQKIAFFLDSIVSQIDSIIGKTKETIEAYKKYKQSIIAETVIKGLDRDVEMQNSGVEWIGEIPKNWKLKKFKYVTKIRSEKGQFVSNDDFFLGLENIESYSGKYIKTESSYDDGFYDMFYEGDILFSKLRPYLTKCLLPNFPGFCTGELLIIKDFTGIKKFLFYYMLSANFIDVINSSTYGTKMPRASWDFIKELPVVMPDETEQERIADFLNQKCAEIDSLISQKQKHLEEMETYKKSLIFECVTGKREVPEIQ